VTVPTSRLRAARPGPSPSGPVDDPAALAGSQPPAADRPIPTPDGSLAPAGFGTDAVTGRTSWAPELPAVPATDDGRSDGRPGDLVFQGPPEPAGAVRWARGVPPTSSGRPDRSTPRCAPESVTSVAG
jgi:hypothetical protein